MRRSLWWFLLIIVGLCLSANLVTTGNGIDRQQHWKSPDGKRWISCWGFSRFPGLKWHWPPWRYRFTAYVLNGADFHSSAAMELNDFPERVTDFTVEWQEKAAILRWYDGTKSAVVQFNKFSALWEKAVNPLRGKLRAPNSKHQSPDAGALIDVWSLMFLWCLVLGA